MKLRSKILLLVIPLIVLPMLVMGWIAYSELNEKFKQKAFAEMHTAIDHLAGHLGLEVETAVANIELFANHILLKKYVLTSDEEERYTLLQAPALRVLASFQEAFANYYEIRILLTDGYEDLRRTSLPIDNLTEEEERSPLFIAMQQAGDSVSTLINRNPDNGELALFVGKPLILRDPAVDPTGVEKTLRGYLTLTIGLDELVSHVSSDVIGKSGFLLATDQQGNTLIRPGSVAVEKTVLRDILDTIARHPLQAVESGFQWSILVHNRYPAARQSAPARRITRARNHGNPQPACSVCDSHHAGFDPHHVGRPVSDIAAPGYRPHQPSWRAFQGNRPWKPGYRKRFELN